MSALELELELELELLLPRRSRGVLMTEASRVTRHTENKNFAFHLWMMI